MIAVPTGGGMQSALDFLSNKESIVNGFREGIDWTKKAIELVRTAAEPNPWKNSTDEEIAGELLCLAKERK